MVKNYKYKYYWMFRCFCSWGVQSKWLT